MGIAKLIYVVFKIRLLTPSALYRLVNAIWKYGINIMTLLCFVEIKYSSRLVLVDEDDTLTYKELFHQSKKLAAILNKKYRVNKGLKTAFLCRNHSSLVKGVFAAAALGTDIYLLNTEISAGQLNKLLARYDFDFIIYDLELESMLEQSNYRKGRVLSYHDNLPAINNLVDTGVNDDFRPVMAFGSKIVLLTSGTTGSFKEAPHKASIFNYLNPFLSLITKLNLLNYDSAYIATPIYHGYGIAVLLSFMALGKKVVISRRFNAEEACSLISKHKIEVVTVVPLMIKRMLKEDTRALKTLQCIASGGAKLNPKLAEKVQNELGDVLYNLYGTSEAGLNMIATPQDLKYSADTIGRKINGVGLKIMDSDMKEVETGCTGEFCIKNKWSMTNNSNLWIKTGDTGYRDSKEYYYLSGRTDDMIVSAGENVYPADLERVIINHLEIEDVAVVGVADEDFGCRMKVFVVLAENAEITQNELLEWLHKRVARFQMPKYIVFVDSIPYTSLGKIDRKKLINNHTCCCNGELYHK